MGDGFRVLFVCTGNICRSPIATYLFLHRLEQCLYDGAAGFAAASAGTGALEDEPMSEHAAQVLVERGVDPAGIAEFRGRQLQPDHVVAADLVLAATREHRTAVASLMPDAVARTFTLMEFALLAGNVDGASLPDGDAVARARELTHQALSLRGQVQPPSPQALDLADPYQLSLDVFRATADHIDEALRVVVNAIASSPIADSGR